MMKILVSCGLSAVLLASLGFAQKGKGDAKKGKVVFEQCGVCHNSETDEKKMGPSLKGLFKKAKLSDCKKVTDETVRARVNTGGNGMPAYEDMLSAEEKDNLLAFLKTI